MKYLLIGISVLLLFSCSHDAEINEHSCDIIIDSEIGFLSVGEKYNIHVTVPDSIGNEYAVGSTSSTIKSTLGKSRNFTLYVEKPGIVRIMVLKRDDMGGTPICQREFESRMMNYPR